jgi:hypothetical protein
VATVHTKLSKCGEIKDHLTDTAMADGSTGGGRLAAPKSVGIMAAVRQAKVNARHGIEAETSAVVTSAAMRRSWRLQPSAEASGE